MKITERKLRSMIRRVIRESQINEMESPFGMDSYTGAAGHGKSVSNMLRQSFRRFEQLMDPIEAMQMGTFATGLITSLQAGNSNILDTQFLAGLGICVGAALWIVIRNYLESGNIMYANKNEADRLRKIQRKIESECPQCMDDVERVDQSEY
tara:strand:- start:2961 stop:3416 length:456 start_codon:yes stop_codon:yes gene_type:complete